jgi:hypothetical protein
MGEGGVGLTVTKGLNMIIASNNLTKIGNLTDYEKLLDKI